MISDKLFKAISENELSVKVCSAICSPGFFCHPEIKPILEEHIPTILTIYIHLLNEIELEEILVSLEAIIEIFNEKVKDFAIDLTKILVERFLILINTDEDNILKSNNNFIIIEGIIKTIISIIGIFNKYSDIFPHIYQNVKKIIVYGFTEEGFEKLEDSIDIITCICKTDGGLLPCTWEFFIPLIESVVGTEVENKNMKEKYPDTVFIGNGYEALSNVISAILLYIVK